MSHIEDKKSANAFEYLLLYTYKNLSNDYIAKYHYELNWDYISLYHKIDIAFIKRYSNLLNEELLKKNKYYTLLNLDNINKA